ncbi:cytochrome c oxidase subunit II [Phycisphaerales bacterium AB-hyl4]|uniref:cytochrome-c oxidase n=1 Tax=Natronomicrosphaera hydrolytica TaxID=3242702 RepID=A0ABV4U1B2_9BACT
MPKRLANTIPHATSVLISLTLLPLLLLSLLLLLPGCAEERQQSALHPEGEPAQIIAGLWWFMFYLLGAVFIIVMGVAAWAVFRPRIEPGEGDADEPVGDRFIIVSGIALPSIVLVVLLVYSLTVTVSLRQPDSAVTIEVIGHLWWWEVRYPDHGIITANELHIPAGEPVHLKLSSADVVHSFWVPQLHGKMDMLPDHVNTFWIQAGRPGTYRGQCAEYCGEQHARMSFHVVALERDEFDQWLARRAQPAREPTTDVHRSGQRAFMEAGCNTCHAISGTEAHGRAGPDLTHMGSRPSIGAGQWPNNYANLAGWIANPQSLKPGNHMPRSYLDADELHEITTYLLSLE